MTKGNDSLANGREHAGDQSTLDDREFRRCLGQFATGVTIITASHEGIDVGVTANSFSALSLEPPLVLWSLKRSSRSFEIFRRSSHFAVHVLSVDQIALSQRFASSEADKFRGLSRGIGVSGSPIINGVSATIECTVESRVDGGDHELLIGRVRKFCRYEREPLVFVQGRYAVAADHPMLGETEQWAANSPDACLDELAPLFKLIFRSHYLIANGFEEQRRAEGLNISQNYVLFGLADNPRITSEELTARVFLPRTVADDAVADLVAGGDALRDEIGRLVLTTKGLTRREVIRDRWKGYERNYLAEFSQSRVDEVRRFLVELISRFGRPKQPS
ncbi:flavin reductase [Bradyrhizobium sp. LTSP885]|uniref:flavin reductase n=1 Tax=Bradyrhizobium sp. LTSP885 TaxID=1619232 RepID=UPI00069B0F03|nr:flavin reductase [Bradyrhizobium sp. LTSP885]